jgi:hypothetical protein
MIYLFGEINLKMKVKVSLIKKSVFLSLISFFFLICNSCAKEEFASIKEVRVSVWEGKFYPRDKKELNRVLEDFLKRDKRIILEGKLKALIVPHAGYIFSGKTAGYAYREIYPEDIKVVIILGANHRYPGDKAYIYPEGYFQTPLGKIKVDERIVKILTESCKLLEINKEAHKLEHSIEVQLPFLQKVLVDFTIVPIIVGRLDIQECKILGRALSDLLKKDNFLLIASSDLSHYPEYKIAKEVDNLVIREILRVDPDSLILKINEINERNIPNLACLLCGKEAVLTLLYAMKFLDIEEGKLLHYTNSGEIWNKKEEVVGYAAISFRKEYLELKELNLNNKEKKELLNIARRSIDYYLKKGKILDYTPKSRKLFKKYAAFVTLKKNGRLRGCIGSILPEYPLYQNIIYMAYQAAFEDSRFSKVSLDELKDIDIEISILSPLKRIKDVSEIEMGKDGVVLEYRDRFGLFLPQVAIETGWSRERFLNELCWQKLKLPPDSWKEKKMNIYTFRVISIKEGGH